ncbi:unnamed protein product [Caenorhabditis bovis]|uniref:Uncharacterized protein n=1 Tax=Caenorhabditis bovis TaxID=2654633 RepID=A0A8S1F324_9PELO|nr:unnamed protein product [Caenorhabditis bovis]
MVVRGRLVFYCNIEYHHKWSTQMDERNNLQFNLGFKLSPDQAECLLWIIGLHASKHLDLQIRALRELELNPELKLTELTDRLDQVISLRADADFIGSGSHDIHAIRRQANKPKPKFQGGSRPKNARTPTSPRTSATSPPSPCSRCGDHTGDGIASCHTKQSATAVTRRDISRKDTIDKCTAEVVLSEQLYHIGIERAKTLEPRNSDYTPFADYDHLRDEMEEQQAQREKTERDVKEENDGRDEDYFEFKEGFENLIGSQIQCNTTKMYYLKSSLCGEAAELVKTLRSTVSNYLIAWSILDDQYGGQTRLQQTLFRRIRELPVLGNSYQPSDLHHFYIRTVTTIRQLASFGCDMNNMTTASLIEAKLPKKIIQKLYANPRSQPADAERLLEMIRDISQTESLVAAIVNERAEEPVTTMATLHQGSQKGPMQRIGFVLSMSERRPSGNDLPGSLQALSRKAPSVDVPSYAGRRSHRISKERWA